MAAPHQWHDVADERDVREPFATVGGREIYLITLTQPAGTLQRAAALFFDSASHRPDGLTREDLRGRIGPIGIYLLGFAIERSRSPAARQPPGTRASKVLASRDSSSSIDGDKMSWWSNWNDIVFWPSRTASRPGGAEHCPIRAHS